MTVIVKPTQEHRQRLIDNIGRDSWKYEGTPEMITVLHRLNERDLGRVIKCWHFRFEGIEPDVRAQMIRSHAKVHNKTIEEAEAFCRRTGMSIPVNEMRWRVAR